MGNNNLEISNSCNKYKEKKFKANIIENDQ